MATDKILIVDDEESVLLTMQAILERDGYEVVTASKGGAALDLVERDAFDLVLTDLRLDDLDGLSILAEVRRRSPDTVAIMLTGYASMESAVQALREGAYDYLIKPCDVEDLRATVARGLERRRLGLQLAARVEELEKANRTIRALNEELQRRVDEATGELKRRMDELARANEEIAELYRNSQQHVEQLEELDELKSRFLSMASHELKTPLTAMSGFAQIVLRRLQTRLERGIPSEAEWEREQRTSIEQVDMLKEQTTKLVRLVDELLDVSRIESGKVEFRFAPLDLQQFAADIVAKMQLTTSQHQISLAAEPPEQLTLMADQDHLEQVLNNLLSNAIKYSPEGGQITLRLKPEGDSVIISVRDQGVGIPRSELDAVFGLFYQSPEPSRRKGGGMGLGLYISKEIVTRHGGRIWVESEMGRGSTFYLSLPRVPVPEPAATGQPLVG